MADDRRHAPLGYVLIGVGGTAVFGVPLARLVAPESSTISAFSFSDALPLFIMSVGAACIVLGFALHFGWRPDRYIAAKWRKVRILPDLLGAYLPRVRFVAPKKRIEFGGRSRQALADIARMIEERDTTIASLKRATEKPPGPKPPSALVLAAAGQSPAAQPHSPQPPSPVMERVTEIKVEQIADDRKRLDRCVTLMERGTNLKGEVAAASVREMQQRAIMGILDGDLRTRLDRWRIDSRGFVDANTYGSVETLVSEKRETELIDEWTKETVLEVLNSHLATLKRVKDSIHVTRLG